MLDRVDSSLKSGERLRELYFAYIFDKLADAVLVGMDLSVLSVWNGSKVIEGINDLLRCWGVVISWTMQAYSRFFSVSAFLFRLWSTYWLNIKIYSLLNLFE